MGPFGAPGWGYDMVSPISETRDRAGAVRLEYRNGIMLKNMETTWGRVIATSARSGGRALKQERVPNRRLHDNGCLPPGELTAVTVTVTFRRSNITRQGSNHPVTPTCTPLDVPICTLRRCALYAHQRAESAGVSTTLDTQTTHKCTAI